MEAPDKVFILYRKDYSDRRIFNAFTEKEDKTDIEYIRKDALLEIIECARHSAIVHRNFNDCPVEQEARIDAYNFIKHKIE